MRKMTIGKAIRINELSVEKVGRNGTVICMHNTRRGSPAETDYETYYTQKKKIIQVLPNIIFI